MNASSHGTIVLVDDEVSIRDLFKTILDSRGYTVISCPDGDEALRQLRLTSADLLITDLVMPKQEGLETIAKARKEFPNVKILVVSGYQQYLKVALLFGADETMLKPVGVKALSAAVGSLIGA